MQLEDYFEFSDPDDNYQKLRDLLKAGKWKEADGETLRVMLKVAGREAEGWLDEEDINHFPCTDLRTIDLLWVIHSNGRFGFSVQESIWDIVGGGSCYELSCEFGNRVGWYEEETEKWKYYSDLTFTQNAPLGHLPTLSNEEQEEWDCYPFFVDWVSWGIPSLSRRLKQCNII